MIHFAVFMYCRLFALLCFCLHHFWIQLSNLKCLNVFQNIRKPVFFCFFLSQWPVLALLQSWLTEGWFVETSLETCQHCVSQLSQPTVSVLVILHRVWIEWGRTLRWDVMGCGGKTGMTMKQSEETLLELVSAHLCKIVLKLAVIWGRSGSVGRILSPVPLPVKVPYGKTLNPFIVPDVLFSMWL